MDGEAGWWTTCGNIGLPPLARVMGVGRQQQHGIESIIIDEKKEKSPYRMRRSDGITHQIFPDHNEMISVMNWVQEEENTQKKEKENSYDKSGIHKVQRDAAKWESAHNLGNVNTPTN